MLRKNFLTTIVLAFSFFQWPLPLLQAGEYETFDEIAQSQAAQFYVAKQFDKALLAFQDMERINPKSVLVKRYMASVLDQLRRWDEASRKLEEVKTLDASDWTACQMLAEIYLKQGQPEEALGEYAFIQKNTGDPKVREQAERRLKQIRKIQAERSIPGVMMSLKDFMQTQASLDFSQGRYPEALTGLDTLISKYPRDVLLIRFKGIALMRLRKAVEAETVFQKALSMEPENDAVRYYLGLCYLELKKPEEARQAFQVVIQKDTGFYRDRAQAAIFKTLGPSAAKSKKWTMNLSQGYEFDTNAVYKSSDPAYRTAGDRNSGRYNTSVTGTYKLHEKKKFSLTADSLYFQSLYDDFPELRTYTFGPGISAMMAFKLFQKPAILNVREGVTWTVLKQMYYLFSNSLSPSLYFFPHKKIRMQAGYRLGVNEYRTDGSLPELQCKDGVVNAANLAVTYYLNKLKTLYVNLGYDFERQDTKGLNYIKNVHGGRLDFHFPLVSKIQADLGFRIKDSDYPHYASTPPRRHDDQMNFSASLMRPLYKDLVDLVIQYSLENTRARNNQYESVKHTMGAKVVCRL